MTLRNFFVVQTGVYVRAYAYAFPARAAYSTCANPYALARRYAEQLGANNLHAIRVAPQTPGQVGAGHDTHPTFGLV